MKTSPAQLRGALRKLLVAAETIYTRVLNDPTLGHKFIRDTLGEANTLLGRSPGVGPREFWDLYEKHARNARRRATRAAAKKGRS